MKTNNSKFKNHTKYTIKMKNIYLIICLLICTLTYSQEDSSWKYLGDSTDGSEIFMKLEDDSSNYKEAWIKTKKPFSSKKNKQGKIVKTGGGYTMGFWKVNCSEKTYSITNRITYNSKGNAISEGEEYYDPRDERVIPDTVGEAIFSNICNNSSEE